MKICIVTNSHHTTDVRLYYKIARSLAKLGEVHLISTSGVRNANVNPYQAVVDSDSNWFALVVLYQKAKEIQPDIVICVEPLTVFVGLALRRKHGTRVIFDVHEFFADAFGERFPAPLSWLMKGLYLAFERWLQRKVDATMGVNDEILDQLIAPNLRSKAVTLPNYPVKNVWEYDCETPADICTICEMDFDLVYVGGLTRNRGVLKILKSVSILKQEFPKFKVLILGKFFEKAVEKEFNDTINALNLNAIIYHQDWLPAERIGLLLKRSKVGLWLFNPESLRLRKALPLKVLEYFAAGLPVVTVSTPLMREWVEDKHLGVCCDFHSASIAKGTAEILRLSKKDYTQMSQRAKDLIDNTYNWESLEPRLFALIEILSQE